MEPIVRRLRAQPSRSWPPNWCAARTASCPRISRDVAAAYAAKLQAEGPVVASRKASQMAIEAFAPHLPELIGGSADLAHSNLTLWTGSKSVTGNDANANYVYYGVREFGMSAISNGLALHGGFLPYDATFLVFSDYSRNALRMSALIPARAIHVFTHDSIGLGEDGPTHQPVEHLASLRYIPNNDVWRPCDAVESAVAWQCAIERRDGPTCLVFSRQNLAAPGAQRATAGADRARRLRAARAGRRRLRPDPDRHRLGSRAGDAGGATSCSRRRQGARGVDALAERVRPAAGRLARVRAAVAAAASASRSKPASPISGASTSAWTAR